jgi:hypothetical protein
MASFAGARGTGNILADQKQIDMADRITELEPDASPLTVFTKRLSKKRTVNPKYDWLENDLEPRFDTVVGAQTNVDTAIEVTNSGYWFDQDIGYNSRTGESFRVTASAGGVLTVVRGVGSTATAMNNLDELIIIGSAAQEGATSKPAVTHNPTKLSNYCQIFRKPFELTETLRHTGNEVSPADWNLQANHAGIEHLKDMEYAFLFGHPSEDVSGAHPRRTTGGFYHFATQNATDVGGTMTETEFFAALRGAFRYGSKTKLALASRLAVDVVNAYPRGHLVTTNDEKTYGVRVMRYTSPHGDLNIVSHPLLEGAVFAGHIAIIDLDALGYRFLAGDNGSRDSKVYTNRQANDADTRKDEYLAEVGLQFGSPKKHATITNITG